jgi:hypothetical protein
LKEDRKLHYLDLAVETLTPTNASIRFRVFNNSQRRITIPTSDLPWNKLTLLIVDPSGRVIPRSEYNGTIIRDWAGARVAIEAGAFLEGRASLHDLYYETALPMLSSTELVLFWTYRIEPVDQEPFERVGGWLPLRKLGTK